MSSETSGHLLDDEAVLRLLEEEVKSAGGQMQWARPNRCPSVHNQSDSTRRQRLTQQIISALGLRRVLLPSKNDLVKRLREEVAKAGSQSEFARRTGLDRTYLTHVLNGRNPGNEIAKALNVTRVVRYAPERKKGTGSRSHLRLFNDV